jgi:hypothetical protein
MSEAYLHAFPIFGPSKASSPALRSLSPGKPHKQDCGSMLRPVWVLRSMSVSLLRCAIEFFRFRAVVNHF